MLTYCTTLLALQVETGPSGVVWALGYDGTAWAYTGGWGGAHFKTNHLVQPVQAGLADHQYKTRIRILK